MITEILNENDTQFTLSIKLSEESQEYFGRTLSFARVPYLTLEQQVEQIVADVESRQVIVEDPVVVEGA